jgi:hypothetical protein
MCILSGRRPRRQDDFYATVGVRWHSSSALAVVQASLHMLCFAGQGTARKFPTGEKGTTYGQSTR